MAKLIVTYENNHIKKELHFAKRVFTYTMVPMPGGKSGDAAAFAAVIEKEFGSEDEELLEAAEKLDYGDESDIEESMSILDAAEIYLLENEHESLNEAERESIKEEPE